MASVPKGLLCPPRKDTFRGRGNLCWLRQEDHPEFFLFTFLLFSVSAPKGLLSGQSFLFGFFTVLGFAPLPSFMSFKFSTSFFGGAASSPAFRSSSSFFFSLHSSLTSLSRVLLLAELFRGL